MHDILIGAPRDMQTGNRPAILQRSDDDFIAATLDELRSSPGRVALAARRARATDTQGTLKLFQPIQRQFHVALLEAWCDTPGAPRVDPKRIDSSGFVVRRVGISGQPEGWMRSNGQARGWVPLSRVGGAIGDPLSQHRLQRQLTGVADIDRQLTGIRLAQSDNLLDEHTVPLFVAPPDVCSDAAKTVFYGIVPTVSGEVSAAAPASAAAQAVGFGPRSDLFRSHLVEALRGDAMDLPFAGEAVAGGWSNASDMPGDPATDGVSDAQFSDLADESSDNSRAMRRFLLMLRQLASEFNAFEGEAAAPLREVLAGIALPLVLRDDETVRRSVPAAVRHAVFWRDQGQCTWRFSDEQRCPERGMLELDHQGVMHCRGGDVSVENLALRCRRHNQHAAEQELGRAFMARARATPPRAGCHR